ncbi:phosphate acyltransferase PlsX [Eremococcus coleocola]|uniref:Phosphate acyltransferase n=1 Tax=Eremococcus coleocola ACS-139-V-Col8 TaxID=908337 RepID=E4KNW9_9LACT|nr:phosphate acyltransferase PlsX [Eremococcus coleocola]EFR31117.1 fatty acid/phospholipid synthesis protein PlsX [Eremococcus coleocola ACS-139-V-Col8]
MYKIAIDAMGGDNAPKAIVDGCLQALANFDDIFLELFGDQGSLESLISNHERISIHHSPDVVTGEDEPVRAVRRKKESSMVMAAQSVKDGVNQAIVSAGNTGALLASGLLVIGRLKNIDRPGLMPIVPSLSSEHPQFILMDAGANAECKPINLHQFAILASYYSKRVLGIESPRVGLINNGTEAGKGSSLTKEVFELLASEESINFIGNIEAKDLLTGIVDVAVTDGFTGNAVLKTLEGTAKEFAKFLSRTLKSGNLQTKLGGLMIKSALKESMGQLDDTKQGGAVLLGIKHPLIKAHGSSNAEAFYNAIRQARLVLESGAIETMAHHFE